MKLLSILCILFPGFTIVWALEDCKDESSSSSYTQGRLQTWISSLVASCLIGFSGIIPIILIPIETGLKVHQDEGSTKYLRLLLSFAVGGLLGDVFLHLLPEAWNILDHIGPSTSKHMTLGLWVLIGMFSFVILEIIFTPNSGKKVDTSCNMQKNETKHYSENGTIPKNGDVSSNGCILTKRKEVPSQNGCTKDKSHAKSESFCEIKHSSDIQVTGYLNLMANGIDNFTHGLAVAGSFLVGFKMGILTTFAILIHEIPHEIGDFAILLKSGFHPWTAAKAQISTATIGVLGVIVALSADSLDKLGGCTSWILPFTAGGFLNIALVNVLPDLLNEKDPWESMKQLACICAGIGVMALVSSIV